MHDHPIKMIEPNPLIKKPLIAMSGSGKGVEV
jgi:hypothetical protein